MFEFIQGNTTAINSIATVILVIVTAYYARTTKYILEATERQSKLSLDPVIGITIKKIEISKIWTERKRRSMIVELELTNVGNAPAIELMLDSEVELRYSNINNENLIPARFEPNIIGC